MTLGRLEPPVRTQISCVAILASLAVGAAAQTPGTRTEPVDARGEPSRIVTIRGCLNGQILTTTDRPTHTATLALTNPLGDRFRVVGDRELLELLYEHHRQEVDLVGQLVDTPIEAGRTGVERRIGDGTRVWIGGATQPTPSSPLSAAGQDVDLPEIELRGLEVVNPSCSI